MPSLSFIKHNNCLYFLGLYETLCFMYDRESTHILLRYQITDAVSWKTKAIYNEKDAAQS